MAEVIRATLCENNVIINARTGSTSQTIPAASSTPIIKVVTPTFPGPYEYTPTQSTQVVAIEGQKASQDITINPIPSNYGLITWNGSVLTVS